MVYRHPFGIYRILSYLTTTDRFSSYAAIAIIQFLRSLLLTHHEWRRSVFAQSHPMAPLIIDPAICKAVAKWVFLTQEHHPSYTHPCDPSSIYAYITKSQISTMQHPIDLCPANQINPLCIPFSLRTMNHQTPAQWTSCNLCAQ